MFLGFDLAGMIYADKTEHKRCFFEGKERKKEAAFELLLL